MSNRYWDEIRRYPLVESEMYNLPPQREALFPRQILEPVWDEWKRQNPEGSAYQFFFHLLTQAKDDRDYAIQKGKVLESFKAEFHRRFKHNNLYIQCCESLIIGEDPYRIIELLLKITDEQFEKIKELVELMPPQINKP